jgi:HEPN domain-containing protein
MNQASAIAEAERLLMHALKAYQDGMLNIADTEVDRHRYQTQLASVPWERFVQKADYSYFVARTLLSQNVYLYGLFCAQQCVEAYLKAFLKKFGAPIPQHHRLNDLLIEAQKVCHESASFFHSPHAEVICRKYDPFYEVARYPAQISRPVGGKYVWVSGMDEQFLDYFVYRMRKLLEMQPGGWDILGSQGHEDLHLVHELRPDFYRLFTTNNLNFASDEET